VKTLFAGRLLPVLAAAQSTFFRKRNRKIIMSEWIPFDEGKYRVERAFLITPELKAAPMDNTYIEIYTSRQGIRRMRGRSLIHNILIVQLLEDSDDIDLILDLGDAYTYFLKKPDLEAGKVFSPHIQSTLQFSPTRPWKKIPQKEFEILISDLKILTV
jgi:hypothetical protein